MAHQPSVGAFPRLWVRLDSLGKTALVTTDLPELREIVEPEREVLMATPGDVDSLTLQIKRVLKDASLRKKLAENAYLKVKQFDTKIITKQFVDLYQELVSSK